MAITEMSLPVDIPWKRMGVSSDMIDQQPGELRFPNKWRSSISVFYHEPPEVPPEYCDRRITYLKIVCTITNYQTDEAVDVTILDELRDLYSDSYGNWKAFDYLTQSYPCHGALLQVSVYPYPSEGVIRTYDFPYISSFQPRKREMYEALTESGEVVSQSGNKMNVMKGGTITGTQEEYDLDLGGGGGSAIFGLASWQSGQQQKGTIDRTQVQNQNITTTDASREKRESNAFSTTLNQLYTLLQGYHLGTNRAVFFMQPRPHMQDAKFSFIQGLRRLEGIQEFFLIVDRPKAIPGFCVEVVLETAHAVLARAFRPRIIPIEELYTASNLRKTPSALGLDTGEPAYLPFATLVDTWNRQDPWMRFLAKEYRDQKVPWVTISELVQTGQTNWIDFPNLVQVTELIPDIGLGDIALIFEEYELDEGWFFVTGRRLHSCTTPQHNQEDNTDCERSLASHVSSLNDATSVVYEGRYAGQQYTVHQANIGTPALNYNAIMQNLNEMLWSSVGSATRFPYGEVGFMETEFALEQLAQVLRVLGQIGVKDRPLSSIKGLDGILGPKPLARTMMEAAGLTTPQVAMHLQVGKREARKIRKTLLLSALKAVNPHEIDRSIGLPNPARERLSAQFSKERMRKLELSAVIGRKHKPTRKQPDK